MGVKSIMGTVAAALTLVTATWFPATTTSAWAATTTPVQAAKGYSRCPQGDVCFFTENNGEGRICHWYGNDPDWLSGSVRCSWAATTNVKSI